MSIIESTRQESNYRSTILDEGGPVEFDDQTFESRRQFVEHLTDLAVARTTFYRLSAEQIFWCDEYTMEHLWSAVAVVDFDFASEMLGLQLVVADRVPKLDSDGDPMVDEDGEPVMVAAPAECDMSFKVTVEGLRDSFGTDIPKGPQKFVATKQPTNRPLTESNVESLERRLPKFALNGEAFIVDSFGNGISVQHRSWAVVRGTLTGKLTNANKVIRTVIQGGIHPIVAMTVDTGRSNTGADIFGSDPSIVPDSVLLTRETYAGTIEETEYRPKRRQLRKSITRECQGAAKMVALRLLGYNVNASVWDSAESTRIAHFLASNVLIDLDDLAAMVDAFLAPLNSKERPATTAMLTAALALRYLKDEEPINPDPKGKAARGGRPIDELGEIKFDLRSVVPLLGELGAGAVDPNSELAEWSHKNLASTGKTKQEKFARLVAMLKQYDTGEPVTGDYALKSGAHGYKEQTAKSYTHFGGADRGPVDTKAKADEPEAEEVAA